MDEEAKNLKLTTDVLERLLVAARSFAANTERHSGVMNMTVMAEVTENRWTVRLVDNGRGFNTRVTPKNVGLREDLGTALRRVGMTVEMTSAPGTGVSVEISGPIQPAQPIQLSGTAENLPSSKEREPE